MKKVYFFLLALSFFSCGETITTYYEYNDVVVTRIDKGNKIRFYYGKCDNPKSPCRDSYIEVKYYGLDGGVESFMQFRENQTVEISRVAGFFTAVGNTSKLFILNEYTHDKILIKIWSDSVYTNVRDNQLQKNENIVYLSDALSKEKWKNKKIGSKVKIYNNIPEYVENK